MKETCQRAAPRGLHVPHVRPLGDVMTTIMIKKRRLLQSLSSPQGGRMTTFRNLSSVQCQFVVGLGTQSLYDAPVHAPSTQRCMLRLILVRSRPTLLLLSGRDCRHKDCTLQPQTQVSLIEKRCNKPSLQCLHIIIDPEVRASLLLSPVGQAACRVLT